MTIPTVCVQTIEKENKNGGAGRENQIVTDDWNRQFEDIVNDWGERMTKIVYFSVLAL